MYYLKKKHFNHNGSKFNESERKIKVNMNGKIYDFSPHPKSLHRKIICYNIKVPFGCKIHKFDRYIKNF